MKKPERTEQILSIAYDMAKTMNLTEITSPKIGKALKISHTIVFTYFGSIDALRTAVARRAIANREPTIVAKLLTSGLPVAAEIPDDLRREVALTLYRGTVSA